MIHHEAHFPAMGTHAHVIVNGDAGLVDVARHRIEDLEAKWSRFRATSEVSILNANRGHAELVSPETVLLVATAVDAHRVTDGRFDASVLGDMLRAGYDEVYSVVAVRGGSGVSLLR